MKTILAVDDEPTILYVLEEILGEMGFGILTARSGEEALEILERSRPDLVLLDIMMPGIGGLETLKILRSHPDFKNLPVVLLSGTRPLVKQTEFGWTDFVYKPFSVAQLVEKVSRLTSEVQAPAPEPTHATD